MAATVEISETNGLSGAPTTTDGISNINFGSHDGPNLVVNAASYPIVIHNTSRSVSQTKWLQFHLVALGGSSNITNLRIWKSSGVYKGTYNGAEIIGSNCDSTGSSGSPGPGGNSIIAYATATLFRGGAGVTIPYPSAFSIINASANNWYIRPLPETLPAFNLSINGSASSATQLTATGFTGGGLQSHGYSDFVVMTLDVDGSNSGIVQGPVNTKVITFTYDES